MNKRQLATKCGVSLKTVDDWLAKGLPHLKANDGAYLFNPKTVQTWRAANIRPATESDPDIRAARLRKEVALAKKHELDVAQREGKLIDRMETCRFIFEIVRLTRDAVLGQADRLCGTLAAESDQHTVHTLLTEEARRICEDLAKNFGDWLPPASPPCARCRAK